MRMASKSSELFARVKSLESTMVSLRSHKRLRICSGKSSVLGPLPSFCDKGTVPPNSTPKKPDTVHPMPSNDVNQPERNMTAASGSLKKITMLKEPAAAERVLLGLLGPDDTRIMQVYADGGLRQNLAHHALAACLHFAMWLKENGDSSWERDETIGRVAELEESIAKKGAETEILRHQVQEYSSMEEYESKLNGVLNDAGQQGKKAKEQEALHHEKATRLDEVLRQLEEAKANLGKVTQGRDMAMTRVRQLTCALTWARQLYEQAEVEMKQVQKEHAKEKIALIAKLELKEELQSQKQKQKKENRVMLAAELIEALSFFWTICNQCKTHHQFFRIYLNRSVHCPNCKKSFMAIEKAPPPCISSSGQQHQSTRWRFLTRLWERC